jgi:hypothetical protein
MAPEFQGQGLSPETPGEDFKPILEGLQGTLEELRQAASSSERRELLRKMRVLLLEADKLTKSVDVLANTKIRGRFE